MTTDLNMKAMSDISELKQDMAQVNTLVGKLDTTIERLTEMSNTVSKLLAVQEHRLETQEKIGTQLSDLIEKRRIESKVENEALHNRISNNDKEFSKKMDEMKLDLKEALDKFNTRLRSLEKWIWMAAGGTAAVGFIIGLVLNISNLLF